MTNATSTRSQRKEAKRQLMLTAAMRIFAQHGYTSTSLDAIALESGVSKPTLYQYFGSKEKLFEAVLQQAAEKILTPLVEADAADSMVESMLTFSRNYAKTVLSPEVLALGRMVLGEVHRFPEMGKHYYLNGPQQALNGIIRYLEGLAANGKLIIVDSELAAHDFWSLILSAPREMCQLMPNLVLEPAEIDRFIFNGLRVFLQAYSANPASDLQALQRLIQPASPQRMKKKVAELS